MNYQNYTEEHINFCQQVTAAFKALRPHDCATDEAIVKELMTEWGLDFYTALSIVNNVKVI
jgi:hypothetical protein